MSSFFTSLMIAEHSHAGITSAQGSNSLINIVNKRESISETAALLLTGDELKTWLTMRRLQLNKQSIRPDQKELAILLNTTQATISRRISILRALRFITLLPSKKERLRSRQSYVIHAGQARLQQVLNTDKHYLVFLSESKDKGTARLRQLCKAELFAIPQSTLDHFNIYLALDEEIPLCTEETTLCTEEIPLCTEETPLCTEEIPLCTEEIPLCTEETTLCTEEIPLCTEEIPLCTEETPLCTEETPLCTEETPLCTEETPLCTEEIPLCTEETPLCTEETPLCTEETPLCTEENKGGIYNHARAPTQRGIIKLKFNNNNQTSKGWGCGGRDFEYFESDKHVGILLEKLESKIGKASCHAVINRLKLGRYEYNGQDFQHITNKEEAEIILVALITRSVNYPLNYTTALLFKASEHQLTYQQKEFEQYLKITGQEPKKLEIPLTESQKKQADFMQIPEGTLFSDGEKNWIKRGNFLEEDEVLRGAAMPWKMATKLIESGKLIRQEASV